MKNIFFIPFLLLLLIGCQNEESAPTAPLEDTTLTVVDPAASVTANQMVKLEVEGMMCEKGCGAEIRKGLYGTGGVADVEVKLDEVDSLGAITVYFDKELTNPNEMIEAIAHIPSGRYSAKLQAVEDLK